MPIEHLLEQRPDLWRGRGLPASAPAGVPTGFGALDQALPWRGWPPDGLSEVLTGQPGAGLALLLPMLVALGHADGARQPRWLLLVDPPFVPYAPALAARGIDLTRLVIVRAGAEGPWAMEQALRSGACAVVVGWERKYEVRSTKYDPDAERYSQERVADSGSRTPYSVLRTSDTIGPAHRVLSDIGRQVSGRRHARAQQTAVLRRLQLAAAAGGTPGVLLRSPAAAGQPSPAMLRLQVQAAPDGLDLTLLKLRGGRAGMTLRVGDVPRVASIRRAGDAMARARPR